MNGFNWGEEQLLPNKHMTELRQTKRPGLEKELRQTKRPGLTLDIVGKAC